MRLVCGLLALILCNTSLLDSALAAPKEDSKNQVVNNADQLSSPYSPPALQYQSTAPRTRSSSNSFNRLLKITPKHLPPPEDGIHDPTNDGAFVLQAPLEAFAALPKTKRDLGNGVDWVKALNNNNITPIWDLEDPEAQPLVMDMNIIRVPKGSMPNELFPHRQHTQILECSNCHPDIFIPVKGGNHISMAANILGQMCGTCHGRVSFPFSQCKRCHSQPKVLINDLGKRP